MTKFWAASALAAGLMAFTAPALADVESTVAAPARACLQLTAAPQAPPRPSGREVRIVTYTVVRTLNVEDEVGHPNFFIYPHERGGAGGCARQERGLPGRAALRPLRGRDDARQR